MMLSKSGVTLGAMCATIVVLFFALFYLINNKHKVNKKIGRLHSSQSFDVVSKKKEKKIDVLLDRLDKRLKDAEIKMPVNRFLAVVLFASVATYTAGYILTDTWLVPVGLLSFPLYFVPDMIISSKRDKVIARFNTELIMVLRRMSAITKNDSVLRALEDVKDYPVYSEKMRILLNKVYLHFSFGDSIEEAFNKVAEEHPSKLLKLVAISINVNKSLGSNLSANLHEIATQIQSEMLMKKEAKAIMATTVATGRLMSILPYGILCFLFVYNKSYFEEFFATLSNQFLFAFILLIMSFGVFIVAKMSKPPEA